MPAKRGTRRQLVLSPAIDSQSIQRVRHKSQGRLGQTRAEQTYLTRPGHARSADNSYLRAFP